MSKISLQLIDKVEEDRDSLIIKTNLFIKIQEFKLKRPSHIGKTSSNALTDISTSRTKEEKPEMGTPVKPKKTVSFHPSGRFIEIIEYSPNKGIFEARRAKENVNCGCSIF